MPQDTIYTVTVQGRNEGLDPLAVALKAVDAAQQGVVVSGRALEQSQAGIGPKITDISRAWDSYLAKTDAASKASQQFARDFGLVGRAFDQGKIGLPEFNTQVERLKKNLQDVGTAGSRVDQSGINKLLNVQTASSKGAAQESASAFEEAFKQQDAIVAARAAHDAEVYQRTLNEQLGVDRAGSSSAKGSASVFQDYFASQDEIQKQAQAEFDMIERARQQQAARYASRAADTEAYQGKIDAANAAGSPSSAFAIDQRMGIGAQPATAQGATYSALAEAAKAQDEATRAAQAASQSALTQAVREGEQAAQAAAASQAQMAREANDLLSKIDPLAHAQQVYNAELARYQELAKAGVISAEQLGQAQDLAKSKLDNITRTYGGDRTANKTKLAANEFTNLGYQVNDIISGFAMGQSPMTIATQQGGQVYQALASAKGGFMGGVSAVTSTVADAAAKWITPATAAVGTLTTVLIAGALAAKSYADQQRALDQALAGIGKQSGATRNDINQAAAAYAEAGKVSISAARDMAAEFAHTGEIGPAMFGGLITATHQFAKVTGEDTATATTDLARAFANPGQGVDDLQKKLGAFDDSQVQLIKHLADSGDRLGAQKALLDAMGPSLTDAAHLTSAWAKAWESVKNAASGAFDAVGSAFSSGTLEQQQKAAQAALTAAQNKPASLPWWATIGQDEYATGNGTRSDAEVKAAQAALDAINKQIEAQKKLSDQTVANEQKKRVMDTARTLNPDLQNVEKMTTQANTLADALGKAKLPPFDNAGINTVQTSFETLSRRIQNATDDIRRFGSEAQGALVRAATEQNRTAIFAPVAKSVSGINFKYDEEARNADSRDLAAIEKRRQLELDTVRTQYQAQDASYRKGLSDVPDKYQDLVYGSATKSGIDPSLLSSVLWQESRYNPNATSSKGAEGIAQFMPGTAKGLGISDPYDPNQAIPGAATLLSQLLARYDNDKVAALVGYNAGPKTADRFANGEIGFAGLPKETQAYVNSIMTQTPNSTAQASQIKSANDNLTAQKSILETVAPLWGTTQSAVDKATYAQNEINDAIAKGLPVGDAERANIMARADAYATLAQRQNSLKLAADIGVERGYIGMDAETAAATQRVRGANVDVDSAAGQQLTSQLKLNESLKTYKDLSTSALTGFVSDLRSGKSAADALTNALNKIADKLISMAMDQVVSKAFAGLIGGGSGSGGLGGLLSGLFGGSGGGVGNGIAGDGTAGRTIYATPAGPGFAYGGFTGAGGQFEPAGIVHRGEYVFDAASVSRIGVGTLEAMRGMPGYAAGGVVGNTPAYANLNVPTANSNKPSFTVNVNNSHPDAQVQTGDLKPDGNGGFTLDVAVKRIEGGLADRAMRGRGGLSMAAGGQNSRALRG